MKELIRPKPTDRVSAQPIIDCMDAIDELRASRPGPGLGKASDGTLFVLPRNREIRGGGSSEDCDGGTLAALDQTQGTQDEDTWDRATDECPVSVDVITDVEYDTANYKLIFRTRTLTFDKCGKLSAVSAESTTIDIVEFVTC